MAPCNGTQQWHHVHSPKVGRHPLPPTVAHYNGTLRWHSHGTTSSAPCSGTLVPRPIRQSGSSPSPPIGSKNPYSYRYLGKKKRNNKTHQFNNLLQTLPWASSMIVFNWTKRCQNSRAMCYSIDGKVPANAWHADRPLATCSSAKWS